LRGVLEALSHASTRKRASDAPANQQTSEGSRSRGSQSTVASGGLRGIAVLAFLWLYQVAMAIECNIRSMLSCTRLQVLDRCFVDDLVSICATLRVALSPALVRFSRYAFPHKRLYHLCGGEKLSLLASSTSTSAPTSIARSMCCIRK
jgi:hypothetical protein